MTFNSAPIALRRKIPTTNFVVDGYSAVRVCDGYKAMRRSGMSPSEARYVALIVFIAGSGGFKSHVRS